MLADHLTNPCETLFESRLYISSLTERSELSRSSKQLKRSEELMASTTRSATEETVAMHNREIVY